MKMELMKEKEITKSIKEKLSQIEQRENIRILYACESGSRAWGFASPNSDYDVRFIFIRPIEDYLRVKELPDYIDAELNEVYDINGWDLKKFFKQVNNSGIARVNLYKKYPDSLKLVHLLPAFFTIGTFLCLFSILLGVIYGTLNQLGIISIDFPGGPILVTLGLFPLLSFSVIILFDATIRNKNLTIGCIAVASSFIQLLGYGSGFLRAWWKRCVKQEGEFEAFKKNFYQ